MIIEVFPGQGFDHVKFGQSRKNIRNLLKESPLQFKKNPWAKSLTDSYDDLGIQLFYDENDCLEFVEILQQCRFNFFGADFRKMKLKEILEVIKSRVTVDGMKEIDGSYIFNELGFGVQSNGNSVQSFFIFSNGKYHEIIESERHRAEYYLNSIS